VDDEPVMDVAHLGHLELLTPKPEASLRFFVDVLGMTESGRKGDSVFLRAGTITSNIRCSSRRRRPPGSVTPPSALEARRHFSAGSRRLKNPASGSDGSTANLVMGPPRWSEDFWLGSRRERGRGGVCS
jgi:catechol 2,3-dioxygenase-like lactoylglutathione lyase family enzyme